jgi:hypothetical protein
MHIYKLSLYQNYYFVIEIQILTFFMCEFLKIRNYYIIFFIKKLEFILMIHYGKYNKYINKLKKILIGVSILLPMSAKKQYLS